MENATKALIIAGAVFIAIVLIAVGVKVLGSTQGTTNEVDQVTEGVGVTIANSQYEKHTGVQTAAQVKKLLSNAVTTWRTESEHNIKVRVESGDGLTTGTYDSANEIGNVMSAVKLNSTYNITVEYNSKGYVETIVINGVT